MSVFEQLEARAKALQNDVKAQSGEHREAIDHQVCLAVDDLELVVARLVACRFATEERCEPIETTE